MYQGFYGLHRPPFAVTPDPGLLYLSAVHREALATIIYGIETRKGFLVCTGEVGTGKTTIIRAFFDQARAETFQVLYVFTPQVTPLEMATHICRELGVPDPDSVFAAVPQLHMKLLEIFESGRTLVLLIDEAQLLPVETIEFLRLLSNFETDTEKLIQIVLVGQPELDNVLARRDMRQVAQRVALRARLRPLDFDESLEYIEHRLLASGAEELGQVLSPSTAWLIAEAGGGVPRVINILADNVLIAGFGAGQRPVGSRLAGTTIRDFVVKSGVARPVKLRRRFGASRAYSRWFAPERAVAAPLRQSTPVPPSAALPRPAAPAGPIYIEPVPMAQLRLDEDRGSQRSGAEIIRPVSFVRAPPQAGQPDPAAPEPNGGEKRANGRP